MVAPFGHSQSSGAHEQDFISHLGQAGMKTYLLGEHNGYWVNTMVYTNTKSQGLVPAYFALIISIVVHVVNHQSVLINTCRRQ